MRTTLIYLIISLALVLTFFAASAPATDNTSVWTTEMKYRVFQPNEPGRIEASIVYVFTQSDQFGNYRDVFVNATEFYNSPEYFAPL